VKKNENNGDEWKCVVKKSKEDLRGLESQGVSSAFSFNFYSGYGIAVRRW
jgi:hypothetical protein